MVGQPRNSNIIGVTVFHTQVCIFFFRMNGNKSKQKRSANLRSFIFAACVMLEMPTWMPPNMYALMNFIILTDIILYKLALENDFNLEA